MIKSKLKNTSYRSIFEDLISLEGNKNFPIISSIISNLKEHSSSITNGGYEFILEKEFLGIFWPPGELEYIKLLRNNSFNSFFEEAKNYFLKGEDNLQDEIIKDCIKLNQNIMRLPFEEKDKILELNYNIADCYDLIKKNKEFHLKKVKSKVKIIKSDFCFNNWNEWMQEVVWYGHRSGRYTCKIENTLDNKRLIENDKSSNVIGNSYVV